MHNMKLTYEMKSEAVHLQEVFLNTIVLMNLKNLSA